MTSGRLSQHLRRLLTSPGEEIGRLHAFLHGQARLWRFCAGRLRENNLMAMSAALSFQTIFALVPALVLAFLAARALGVLENSKASLHRVLQTSAFSQIAVLREDETGATPVSPADPATVGKVINVADEIEALVNDVERKLTFERVGPVGAALFIWTALTLLTTLEQSLNRVFQAARSRSVARRVLLYWSAITLGPVALALAIYLGGQAWQAFESWPVLSWLFAAAGWASPVLVSVLGVAAVYVLMPNTAVNRHAALGGALVAVLLWLAGKWAFSLYVERFVVKGNLYGIIGVVPVFMLWLNFSWLIFLFGAELAHTAANISQIWRAEETETTFVAPADALAVTLAIARAYQAGQGPVSADTIAAQVRLPGEGVQWLLDRLAAGEFVCPVNGETEPRYVLARPPAALRVGDVLKAGERRLPQGKIAVRTGDPAAIAADINSKMRSAVATLTVADVLAEAQNAPEPKGVRSLRSERREGLRGSFAAVSVRASKLRLLTPFQSALPKWPDPLDLSDALDERLSSVEMLGYYQRVLLGRWMERHA